MKEIWKDIKNFEGYYQISNLGRVKSLKRIIIKGDNSKQPIKERILLQGVNDGGYYIVGLYKNGHGILYRVHRLIAMAFIPNPTNKCCINHKDGNKINNDINNLEWVTYSENAIHAYRTGLKTNPMLGKLGAKCPNSKPVLQFTLDNKFVAEYPAASEASKKINISRGNINSVCTGKRKSAGGYIWKHKD